MNTYLLSLLIEEHRGEIEYALPSSIESWDAARESHPVVSVTSSFDRLVPPCRLVITAVVISRELDVLAYDLRRIVERDAPSLFRRYRENAVDTSTPQAVGESLRDSKRSSHGVTCVHGRAT